MIKKLIISTAVLVGIGFYAWGKDFPGKMAEMGKKAQTFVGWKKESHLKRLKHVGSDLKRANKMVAELRPEIDRCMTQIAEQEVELETLKTDIANRVVLLKKQEKVVLALREALRKDQTQYVFADVPYTKAEVKADLERRWAAYQRGDAAVKRDKKILAAREQSLAANRTKLHQMTSAKEELAIKIAELEAKLRAVQAAEQVEEMKIDDSQLTKTQQFLSDIEKRLKIRQRRLEEKARTVGGPGRIELEKKSSKDVTESIDVHFGRTPGDALKSNL